MSNKTARRSFKASLKVFFDDKQRVRKWALPTFFLIGVAAVVLTGVSIVILLNSNKGTDYQNGVGADGFRAYIEDKGDLGVGSLVTKDQVTQALGDKAKSVGRADISKVFNYNGDRGQTISFSFVRADNMTASLYVDKKIYKDSTSMKDDNLYVATASAGTINGLPAFYKHAQTISADREYHIMVVDGLTAYRFVIAQPEQKITISEIDADALLKKLAGKVEL